MSEEEQMPEEIPAEDWAQTPSSVKVLLRAVLQATVQANTQIVQLQERITQLEQRLNQNSNNSSRPPSSDPPGTPKYPERKPKGGTRGGQYGHKGHHLALLPVEKVDEVIQVYPQKCPGCAKDLPPGLPDIRPVLRKQQRELPPISLKITEYQLHAVSCPECGKSAYAEEEGLHILQAYGPRLGALVGLLHSQGESFGQISLLGERLFNWRIPKSSLSQMCTRLNQALEQPEEEISQKIKQAPVVYMDETTWLQNGQSKWMWVQASAEATIYRVVGQRNKTTLSALLGAEFAGLLVSDRLGTYNLIEPERRQICLAHLKRNLLGLAELKGEAKIWALKLLRVLRRTFIIWGNFRKGELDRPQLQRKIVPLKERTHKFFEEGANACAKVKQMSQQLRKLESAMWLFAQKEEVEPTNNISERSLRRAVIWRKLSFGTQSDEGSQFVGRILSVTQTARQQNRDVFAYLTECLRAFQDKLPAPTLFFSASPCPSVIST